MIKMKSKKVVKICSKLSSTFNYILPVNSKGYYIFQVEWGTVTNQDFYVEIVKHKFIFFNLVLCNDHSDTATI